MHIGNVDGGIDTEERTEPAQAEFENFKMSQRTLLKAMCEST